MSGLLKVLMVVPSYKPAYIYGGPVKAIALLCEALTEAGHRVTVYTTTANGKRELEVPAGIPTKVDGVEVIYFRRLTKGHSHFSPSLLIHLYKNIQNFDVIHIQSWWNMVVIPATMICLRAGKTPIISPRGSLTGYTLSHGKYYVKRFIHAMIGRLLLRNSVLHFTTNREKEETERMANVKSSYVLPNLSEVHRSMEHLKRDTSCFTLLYLGRIEEAKNLELLIDIFSRPFSFPIQLIIAGSGRKEYIDVLSQQSNQNPRITWKGFVEGPGKISLIASSDLLVLTSHTENYGNVIVEALAQGTPVLISGQVGLKDYVQDYNLGWIAEGNAEAWVNTIEHIFRDSESRERIRAQAPAIIRETLNKDVVINQYIKMYEACIE